MDGLQVANHFYHFFLIERCSSTRQEALILSASCKQWSWAKDKQTNLHDHLLQCQPTVLLLIKSPGIYWQFKVISNYALWYLTHERFKKIAFKKKYFMLKKAENGLK